MAEILSNAEVAFQLGKVHNYLLKCEKLLDEAYIINEDVSKALTFLIATCEKEVTKIGAKK